MEILTTSNMDYSTKKLIVLIWKSMIKMLKFNTLNHKWALVKQNNYLIIYQLS